MVVAHLYSDLLNLYGNDGNIKILEQKLKEMGVKYTLKTPTINDELDFSSYDFIYIGSGTEENQKLAINDLKKYKEDIKNAINNNKVFLVAGNSLDIFGKVLEGKDQVLGLDILNYKSKYVERIKKDVVYNTDFLKNPILGFENHNYVLEDNKEDNLFSNKGIRKNNFMGTYVEGPILVRNPEFLKYIIKLLVEDEKQLKKLDLKLETKAYSNFKDMLIK